VAVDTAKIHTRRQNILVSAGKTKVQRESQVVAAIQIVHLGVMTTTID
jgi:hypothetical protein